MREPVVEARDVRKRFGASEVLRGLSLSVTAGETVSVIGPSGSGKSTFLRCINHLEKIDSGTLTVDGDYVGYKRVGNTLRELNNREIAAKRARIGMVFQRFNLFAHRTALENVIEGPIVVKRQARRAALDQGMSLLARVGLAEKAGCYPAQLSGGQQQRVAIARALAMQPALLLFDEPTSALDPERVGEVLDVIRTLASDGMTMIVVTHEMMFAREVSTLVAVMDEGIVVECETPERLFSKPEHFRTRSFLAKIP